MKKYEPLYTYLIICKKNVITLSYSELEGIISDKLPVSAYKHRPWWGNGSHIQSESWLTANYKVTNVVLGDKVTFEKII